jgi:hypothetical protein
MSTTTRRNGREFGVLSSPTIRNNQDAQRAIKEIMTKGNK